MTYIPEEQSLIMLVVIRPWRSAALQGSGGFKFREARWATPDPIMFSVVRRATAGLRRVSNGDIEAWDICGQTGHVLVWT